MSGPDEIESKILEINEAKVVASIEGLWWILEYKEKVLSSVRMINQSWEKVRIRCHWDHVLSEKKWKWKKNWSSKQRPETIDMVFCNLEQWVKFYKSRWYEVIREDIKTRTTYILQYRDEKVKLEIDKYSNLNWLEIPPILEIEASNEQIILRVAMLLWFDDNDLCDWWTTDLSNYYMTRNEIWFIFELLRYPNLLKDRKNKIFVFLILLNIFNRVKEPKISLIDLLKYPEIFSNPEFKTIITLILWKTLNYSKKELDKKNKDEEKNMKSKSKKKKS